MIREEREQEWKPGTYTPEGDVMRFDTLEEAKKYYEDNLLTSEESDPSNDRDDSDDERRDQRDSEIDQAGE